jgi:glycosyltransferase involved in cell wall biosynthesis
MNLELPPSPHGDVVTIHDVVAWTFPDESAPVAAAAEEVRNAAAVVCVSQYTAERAVELLGVRNPYVIYNGVDEHAFDPVPATPEALRAMGVPGPFVLHAGGAARRKNLEGLAAAWPEVAVARPDLSLVLAGPEHPRRTQLFAGLPRVVIVGRVQQVALRGLYGAASAVVVPSLVEGFGLPALEGMAAGVPVVVARTSSLPEVVGDGGLIVDPVPQGIAEGIIDATSGSSDVADLALRGRKRAGQFTWERSVLEHAKVWTSLR